ncbi:helix-turn-helix transcriptional regulator [Streptosporangium sp. CA-115845]|uniref:helix-turn-helix transcriptional regulator n=1 Tax=Streptosporangium sp. CA-115845 TaxID=3240071 RepID=UPI003D8A949A
MSAPLRIRHAKLAKYREQTGLTTEQRLADAMGVNQGTVNRILRGSKIPSARFICALVRAFDGATFDELWEITISTKQAAK